MIQQDKQCMCLCVSVCGPVTESFGAMLGLESKFVPLIEFFTHCGRVWKGDFQAARPWRVHEETISTAAADVMVALHH